MLNIGLYLVLLGLIAPQTREEPVFDLSDSDCRGEVLIADIEQAYVYASCTSSGSERIMWVYVVNRAAPTLGPLREFSIGFCGRVSSALPDPRDGPPRSKDRNATTSGGR